MTEPTPPTDTALFKALKELVVEAQAVADDHHRPRYMRLDQALASARNAMLDYWAATPQPTQAQAGAITPPPIECDTEDLKRAYAFGWWSALEKQRETAQAGAVGKAVHQFCKKHCADWYDGFADHSDGGGPYEERTLYTAEAVPLTCEWTHNDDDGFWETACGEAWRFDDGGPAENSMHFCHSCGKSLRIKGGQHGTE